VFRPQPLGGCRRFLSFELGRGRETPSVMEPIESVGGEVIVIRIDHYGG
jgi:hypothetical protein